MIKIKKQNFRSLVFLLLIAVAATGLSGALSFAAPTAGQANNNKARTKAPQRDETSPTKRPSTECMRNCRTDYKTCASESWQRDRDLGLWPGSSRLSCNETLEECMNTCNSSRGQDNPAKRIKARPRTPRPPTP